MPSHGIGKWECAISAISSTSDIVFMQSTGDYTAKFIEDATIGKFKLPPKQKKKAQKQTKRK